MQGARKGRRWHACPGCYNKRSMKVRKFTDEQAAMLIIAGRFLQSPNWPSGRRQIRPQAGEPYPEAVLREILALSKEEQQELRELAMWVRSYEKAGG